MKERVKGNRRTGADLLREIGEERGSVLDFAEVKDTLQQLCAS
jgi:hypothetical protein